MNCQACHKFLPLFIDFPLPYKKRRQIEEHLKDCEACRKELTALSRTIKLVRQASAPDMPKDFLPRLRASLKSERPQRREWRLWNPWAWGTISAAAVILLTLVLYQPFNDINLPRDGRISGISPAPAVNVKVPAMVPADDSVPPAWFESEAPMLEKYKRKINLIFDQTEQQSVNFPMSKKNDLYHSVGYAAGASANVRRSGEIIPIRKPEPLYRPKKEWAGERCSITTPRNILLRNSEDLKALWREAGINSISRPKLDWTKQMLGAIFLGKQPGREYEIQLNEIQKMPENLVIKYRVIAPPENSAQETTCPFLLFTLPVSPFLVEFSIEK